MNIKSQLRQDLLFLNTTDRVPVRTAVVAHVRVATAKVEEGGVVTAVGAGAGRPVVAEAASIGGTAVVVAVVAGSREKYLGKTINISVFANKIRAVLVVFS